MAYPRLTEDDLQQFHRNMGKVGGRVEGHALRGRITRTEPVSSPVPSPQKLFDSKWEETYCAELVLRKHAGLIRSYHYHPFSMWLPGGVRYTPDFLIEYPLGMEKKLEVIDVKGWHKNIRAAMVKIRIAASIFDCYTWKLVKKQKGGGWSETVVEAS